MKKILNLTVILLLIIFYACNKDEVTELTTEQQRNGQPVKIEKNSQECDYEENVFDAFCYDPSPVEYVVVKKLTNDLPDNYVSFKGDAILEAEISKVTPLIFERGEPIWLKIREGQQDTYVFPFVEGNSKQPVFYVSTTKEHYILTASDHWYIDEVTQGKADGNLMNQIRSAMLATNSDITIGDPDVYARVSPCDGFKTRAIDKYIKTWGIEEYIEYPDIRGAIAGAFGEQGVDLNDVGADCGDMCVDPIQLTQTFLSFTQFAFPEIAEIVKENLILHTIGWNQFSEDFDEVFTFSESNNDKLLDIMFNSLTLDGSCEGGEAVAHLTSSIYNGELVDGCSGTSSNENFENLLDNIDANNFTASALCDKADVYMTDLIIDECFEGDDAGFGVFLKLAKLLKKVFKAIKQGKDLTKGSTWKDLALDIFDPLTALADGQVTPDEVIEAILDVTTGINFDDLKWIKRVLGFDTIPGLSGSTLSDAFDKMRNGGTHAIRHLADAGFISKYNNRFNISKSLEEFKEIATPILQNPIKVVPWKQGNYNCSLYLGEHNGEPVVFIVADSLSNSSGDPNLVGSILTSYVLDDKNCKSDATLAGILKKLDL